MASQALVVRGGYAGHTPVEASEVFIPFLREQGYDVTVSDSLDAYADEPLMARQDLIVPVWTMGQMTGPQWKVLNKTVKDGCGFAAWHGGIVDAFRVQTGYQFMTGGQFVAHPGGCDFSYMVNVVDKDHEITRGIDDFEMPMTEQYYMHVDPGIHTLCTTTFTGEHSNENNEFVAGTVMPYCWTRQWGKGKVFVAAWGHNDKDFDVPQAKQIVERGLLWASR